jgi:hypothetical protein
MATYREIQARVQNEAGFVVKTCWIAHVLSDHGLTRRTAPNRANQGIRVHPCPPGKRAAIEAALRHFAML